MTDGEERGGDAAPFVSWLVSERTLEPGLVDTLADIIKDQLYVNPLEYLEADHGSEVKPNPSKTIPPIPESKEERSQSTRKPAETSANLRAFIYITNQLACMPEISIYTSQLKHCKDVQDKAALSAGMCLLGPRGGFAGGGG